MPQVIKLFGYTVYFWSREDGEPVHVHVCKGTPQPNATKIWLRKDGPVLAHNNSRIPQKDLKHILEWLALNRDYIVARWYDYFYGQNG